MCHVGNNGLEDLGQIGVGKKGRKEDWKGCTHKRLAGFLRSWNLEDRNGKRNVGVNAFRFVDTWHFAMATTYQKS